MTKTTSDTIKSAVYDTRCVVNIFYDLHTLV